MPLAIERYGNKLPPPVGRGAGGEGGLNSSDSKKSTSDTSSPHPSPVPKGEGTRVHIKLPQGVAPGQTYAIDFRAVYTPAGWMSDWKSQSLDFPMFNVAGAASDEGALAVAADDGLDVRSETLQRLVPIVD